MNVSQNSTTSPLFIVTNGRRCADILLGGNDLLEEKLYDDRKHSGQHKAEHPFK